MGTGRSMRRLRPLPFALSAILASSLAAVSCTNQASTEPGDPPADAGMPSALGNGLRIAELNNPSSPQRPAPNQMNVNVTGATYVVEDKFDETGIPSGVGAIYVQDAFTPSPDAGPGTGGGPPFSGIELYKTTFEPASLALAPGDVIDFTGEYQEYAGTGTTLFPAGQTQPEMYEPIVTFRFDYKPPPATWINLSDLNVGPNGILSQAEFNVGYQWMSMLVTVKGVTLGNTLPDTLLDGGHGRNAVFLTANSSMDAVAMDNSLFDLGCPNATCTAVIFDSLWTPPPGTTYDITGIVQFFYAFHISPRSMDDIVVHKPAP
jgi:hypothetical protein